MKKVLLLATIVFAFSGLPALAEHAPASGDASHGKSGHFKMFEETDTDDDGVITKAEFTASSDKKFAEIDTNNDGKITKEEITARREAWHKKMKDMRDKKRADKEGAAPVEAPAQ